MFFITKRKAQKLIDAEFERALGVKRFALREWAREANYNVYTSQNYRAALAAFQDLERVMGPAYDYDALNQRFNVRELFAVQDGKVTNAGS
jgi:hypothetical protein